MAIWFIFNEKPVPEFFWKKFDKINVCFLVSFDDTDLSTESPLLIFKTPRSVLKQCNPVRN